MRQRIPSSIARKLCSRNFRPALMRESCGAGSRVNDPAAACHSEPEPSHRRWPAGYRSLLAVVRPQRILSDKDRRTDHRRAQVRCQVDQRARQELQKRSRVRACSSPRALVLARALGDRDHQRDPSHRRSDTEKQWPVVDASSYTPPKGLQGQGCRRDTWRDCARPFRISVNPGTHTHRAYSSRHWRIAPCSWIIIPKLFDDGVRALQQEQDVRTSTSRWA